MQVKLLRIREAHGEEMTNPASIAAMMTEEAHADRECMWTLHLDLKMILIEKELVAVGALDTVVTAPREVFKKAVLNSSAAIIVVHNHPSGDPEPSEDDKEIAWHLISLSYRLLVNTGRRVNTGINTARKGVRNVSQRERWRIRKMVQRMIAVEQCSDCGNTSRLHRHHRDGNLRHNTPDNIQVLCRTCHAQIHREMRRDTAKAMPLRAINQAI